MQKLVEGLHKFHSDIVPSHKHRFHELAKGQHPEALFITCSDSRINPNLITQTEPGELFILRNAGNIIPPYGAGSGGEAATIEFALTALGVKHIVVCGHTLCGAMRGLLDQRALEDMPAVKAWLTHAEATRRLLQENYPNIEGDARVTLAAEENVLIQIQNLRTHPVIQSRLARGELALYGWMYKIQTGEVFQFDHEQGQFVLIVDAGGPAPITERAAKRRAI